MEQGDRASMPQQRLPFSMLYYAGIGAVLIIWSGVKLVATPFRRR